MSDVSLFISLWESNFKNWTCKPSSACPMKPKHKNQLKPCKVKVISFVTKLLACLPSINYCLFMVIVDY